MANDDEITLGLNDEITLGGGGGEMTLETEADEAEATPTPEEAEAVASAEVSAVLQGFRGRARAEEARFDDATDSEYWCCLCFQTREQKEEFLRLKGWADLGDKYLDGMDVARQEGLRLTSRVPPLPKRNLDRRYIRLAQEG